MSTDQKSIQTALNEIIYLKKIVNQTASQTEKTHFVQKVQTKANLIIHSMALIACAGMIFVELVSSPSITEILQASHQEKSIQYYGIGFMTYVLFLLCSILYFIIWRGSRNAQISFEKFISQNFNYLKNVNLLSDLVIKLGFIAALLLAERPEWISVALTLFIADYLIQGRLFNFSLKTGYLLSASLLILTCLQIFFQKFHILIPLTSFCLMMVISMADIIKSHKGS